MTPEELAEYRKQKVEKQRLQDEKQQQLQDETLARYHAEEDAIVAAMTKTIMPYLERVKRAMGGALTVRFKQDTEKNVIAIEVSLDGRAAEIKRHGSNLQVNIKNRHSPYDFVPYAPLRSASDVSDETLGKFIKHLMDSKD